MRTLAYALRALFTFAMFAAIVACFGSDYQVHHDPGFASTIVDAAHAAAADWEANVPVKFSFAVGSCPSPRELSMICMHPVDAIPAVPWEPGTLTGYTVFTEMWLVEHLLEGEDAAHRQRLIAHEMGHAMGLLHTGPGTLMYPSANGGSLVVTPADVAQWRAVRGLK